ncbi:lipocalin family protein [Sediminibacter sp. Hel_I_10]|uniref:lipocalin family protein n=1 Tax=Sediminibacter sp. Hel_I_10 TaxID=1392490 RepID=UPI000689A3E0|nr:lipocalin family protein [Sediminibacter sp. Hel_I_10]
MKSICIVLTCLLVLSSCSNDDDNSNQETSELLGTWQLIEIYADPGDGSGDFMTVDSDKTISFESDGTVASNGSLCGFSTTTGEVTTGTYSESDSTISGEGCSNQQFLTSFNMENARLILSFPCIEACQEKYIKL